MYKLSIEFKTKQELVDFLLTEGNGNVALGATIETKTEPAKEEPAKKAAVRNRASKTGKPESPVSGGLDSTHASPPESPVQPEVVVSAPVNREQLLATATALVAELKGSGLADEKIMPHIHEVYAQANCPLNLRISQFDDAQLVRFIPLFQVKVDSIVVRVKAPAPAGAFI